MNRTSKMVTLFKEKLPLRKNVDYQECLLRLKIIKCSSSKGLLRKVHLIHIGKVFFLWIEDRTFSKRSSLLSLKTGLFQREVACNEESSI